MRVTKKTLHPAQFASPGLKTKYPKSYGPTAVNCGTIRSTYVECCGKVVMYEALGWKYSKHVYESVVLYAIDGNNKVDLCFDGKNFYISRYDSLESLQRYWGTSKSCEELLNSEKYGLLARAAIECYNECFVTQG